MSKKDENALKCSFCGKGQDEVKNLLQALLFIYAMSV